MKYILVAIIGVLIYRFWDNKPALKDGNRDKEEIGFTDYEELE